MAEQGTEECTMERSMCVDCKIIGFYAGERQWREKLLFSGFFFLLPLVHYCSLRIENLLFEFWLHGM